MRNEQASSKNTLECIFIVHIGAYIYCSVDIGMYTVAVGYCAYGIRCFDHDGTTSSHNLRRHVIPQSEAPTQLMLEPLVFTIRTDQAGTQELALRGVSVITYKLMLCASVTTAPAGC